MAKVISGIYAITNMTNNKKYVGQAGDIYWRWRHHKSDLRGNRHHNKHLQNSWNMYGEDNFEFSIIEECPISMLDEREIYWIDKLKTYVGFDDCQGYNDDLGGKGIRGYKHSQEEIDKMRRIQNPGIVLQFDLNFEFVKEWIGGVSHISKELGYTKECILLRCNHTILNKMTPYKNSYWIYKKEYESNSFSWSNYLSNVRKKDEKVICQYNRKFELLRKWYSHYDLKTEGYNLKPILSICNHNWDQKIYRDCIWAYEDYDFSDGYFGFYDEYKKGRHNCRKVSMKLEKNGDTIKNFDSITEACRYLGKPDKFRNNIIKSISKNQRSAGYYWKYID